MMKSAPSANVHHIFWPFTTHSSPTSSARQRIEATSEPAPGSESAKAPRHSPRAIFGSISLRLSSLKPAPMPLPRAMMLATLIHARAPLVSTLRLPGDDAEGGATLRLALRDDAAPGGDRVSRIDRAEERDVLDAEERAARLGEVLHRETDHRAQHEERIDHHARVAVRARVLRGEVDREEAQRHGREQRVVAFVERPPQVVFEDLAVVKVLEGVALGDECERGEIGVRHGGGLPLAQTYGLINK